MAKKMKPGQKRCPSCGASVSGPRTKTCPKCGHEFSGKPQKGPAPKGTPVTVAAAKPTKNGGKPQVGRTQAVRDYLKDHPDAMTGEIAAALNKQGIVITSSHVAAIRAKISKTGTARKESKNGGMVTLDTPQVSKTQAVRDYLKTHRGATPLEIVAAMAKQGIKMSRSHAANIKTTISKEVAKKPDAIVAAALAVETPTKPGGTITLEQVKKVAQTIKTIGGFQRVLEVLEVIKELGGVKKFRELAEAVTAPVTDEIPF